MPLLTVTLGTGATRFTSNPWRAMGMKAWQGASPSFIGDSSAVTTSTGIPVPVASTTVPPLDVSGFTSGAINLNQWYAIGTSGDVVHIQYTAEE
jgi:hypothetical protein